MTQSTGLKYAIAVTAMVLSAAAWGLGTVATKQLLETFPPIFLLSIQLSASVGFLWLLLGLQGRVRGWRRGDLPAALTGFLEPGLAYSVGVLGLALTSAANASVLSATEPLVIVLLVWLFFGQRPQVPVVITILIGSFGVCLVTIGNGEFVPGRIGGDLLILAGVGFAALYVIASSRFVQHYDPLHLTALQHSAGLLLACGMLFFAWGVGFEALPSTISWKSILFAAATGILQYSAAFWLYLKGLKVLPVQSAGAFLLLTPVFGVAAAMLFLNEALQPAQWLGCAIVLLSLVVVLRKQRVG